METNSHLSPSRPSNRNRNASTLYKLHSSIPAFKFTWNHVTHYHIVSRHYVATLEKERKKEREKVDAVIRISRITIIKIVETKDTLRHFSSTLVTLRSRTPFSYEFVDSYLKCKRIQRIDFDRWTKSTGAGPRESLTQSCARKASIQLWPLECIAPLYNYVERNVTSLRNEAKARATDATVQNG